MQYARNDMDFHRGTFRVRGDTVEIIPMYEEQALRIEFFGDEIESLHTLHPVTGEVIREENEMYVFPASHYVASPDRMNRAITDIEDELRDRLAVLESQNKLVEAQRLRMRTTYDLEMMEQMGSTGRCRAAPRQVDGAQNMAHIVPDAPVKRPVVAGPGHLPATGIRPGCATPRRATRRCACRVGGAADACAIGWPFACFS